MIFRVSSNLSPGSYKEAKAAPPTLCEGSPLQRGLFPPSCPERCFAPGISACPELWGEGCAQGSTEEPSFGVVARFPASTRINPSGWSHQAAASICIEQVDSVSCLKTFQN